MSAKPLPRHIGFIPDGNRRWAASRGWPKEAGYASGIAPGLALLVVGDERSAQFPAELKPFRQRRGDGIKVNFLVNYGWEWDLDGLRTDGALRSADVSRLELIVRWGGGRRLSGFLPAQSVYADFHVVDDYWPDYDPQHLESALTWFRAQDRTLGG